MVPEQFFFEVLSVLCRKLSDSQEVMNALQDLSELVPLRFPMDSDIVREATLLAREYGLSGYDACYVALAKLTGSLWLTADRAAHERVAPLGLSRLVSNV